MQLAMWFWLFYAILVLWSGWWCWRLDPAQRPWLGQPVLLLVLMFILGWKVFGSPVGGG
jgi:hypothetical protein